MLFFDRFFGKKGPSPVQPDIPFGRFTDVWKSAEQLVAWDLALQKFEAGERMEAWKNFFQFLQNEDGANLRAWENGDGGLHFELSQGSKKVVGSLKNGESVRAEARIAQADVTNVGFMRRLVEVNRLLRHTRFALDPENRIVLLFSSDSMDASPFKLLAGLKELATQADKHDDILLAEFRMLDSIDDAITEFISDSEKQTKINYLRNEIHSTFEQMDSGEFKAEQASGAQAYLLLNLIYRLDFLVRPEGFTTETLERIHRTWFENDGKNKFLKVQAARKELQKILDRTDEDLAAELYRTTATFGITRQVEHEKVAHFIDGEMPSLNFLIDSGQEKLALKVPGYVVGYSLFNYALPKPDHELFLLFLKITEVKFFRELGFVHSFWAGEMLHKKSILEEIEAIVGRQKSQYPNLNPAVGELKFESLALFARSFLLIVRDLNLARAF